MDKVQAINVINNLANLALKQGIIDNLNDAAAVHAALVVLNQDMGGNVQPKENTPEGNALTKKVKVTK